MRYLICFSDNLGGEYDGDAELISICGHVIVCSKEPLTVTSNVNYKRDKYLLLFGATKITDEYVQEQIALHSGVVETFLLNIEDSDVVFTNVVEFTCPPSRLKTPSVNPLHIITAFASMLEYILIKNLTGGGEKIDSSSAECAALPRNRNMFCYEFRDTGRVVFFSLGLSSFHSCIFPLLVSDFGHE